MASTLSIRQALVEAVQARGVFFCSCPESVEALLRDRGLAHLAASRPLVESVRCGFAAELVRFREAKILLQLLLREMISRLEQNLADVRKEQVDWIVETWVMALGLTPYRDMLYPGPASAAADTATETGHAILVSTVAFDRSGERLVSAGWDRSVRVWDAYTHREMRCFGDPITNRHLVRDDDGGSLTMFHCAAFCPSGDTVLAGAENGALYSWRLADGEESRIEHAHTSAVLALAVHPDGRRFASAGRDGQVVIWNLPGVRRLRRFDLSEAVHRVAFSPNGRLLVASCHDGSVHVIHLETNVEWAHLKTDDCPWRSLAFSPDGRHLATGGMSDSIAVWDARTWEIAQRFRLRSDADEVWVPCVGFDRIGKRVAAGGSDGVVRILDLDTATLCSEIAAQDSPLWTLAFDPMRDELAIGGSTGRITWHGLENPRPA